MATGEEVTKKEPVQLITVSEALFSSKLVPNVQNKFGAFAVIQYGAELGIGPMTSLQTMSIIKGKICMAAQMMLTLALKKGVSYKVTGDSNTESKVHFERQGYSPYDSSFTIEDAKKAGIYRPDSGWEKFPKDMLFWRAVTRGLRRIAPDVILGLYAKEEIEDAPAIDATVVGEPDSPEPEKKEEFPPESEKPKLTGAKISVKSVTMKEKKADGTPMKNPVYIITADSDVEYRTFDKKFYELAMRERGTGVVFQVEYEKSQFGLNLKSFEENDVPN